MAGDSVRRLPHQLAAVEPNASGGRPEDAGNEVEHGRLAGAVWPDQADDLTGGDVDLERVARRQPAETPGQAPNLEDSRRLAHVFHSGSSTMAPAAASRSAASASVTAGSSEASTAASAVINSSVPPIVWRGRMETVPSRPSGR